MHLFRRPCHSDGAALTKIFMVHLNIHLPLIGIIPGFASPDLSRSFSPSGSINFVDFNYSESIENAGGAPCIIPYTCDDKMIARYCEIMDGLMLIGGADVDAERYGQRPLPSEFAPTPERDEFEIAFLRSFKETGKPVFGICRGIQLLNVALGGTLIQDIPSRLNRVHHMLGVGSQEIAHEVRICSDSLIARILGSDDIEVNSFHHQCVDRLGNGLRAVGHSEEGIVEVVEHESHPFMLAVQWHPERMRSSARQLDLFKGFVRACCESEVVQV
jgi:putative glutamine amidotransferase